MRPELISVTIVKFAQKHGIEIPYSQPGKPMQNGLVERLNGIIRRECLNLAVFKTIAHVQEALDMWWHTYKFERSHSSLKYRTPDSRYLEGERFQHQLVTP